MKQRLPVRVAERTRESAPEEASEEGVSSFGDFGDPHPEDIVSRQKVVCGMLTSPFDESQELSVPSLDNGVTPILILLGLAAINARGYKGVLFTPGATVRIN